MRLRRLDTKKAKVRTTLELLCLETRETPAVGFTATGAAVGQAPLVTVSRPDGSTLAQFLAYDAIFLGGVNVATGEIDGNANTVEVVTGAGAGGGPHVKVFSVDTTTGAVSTLASFMAYDPIFAGGVHVATGSFGIANVDKVITGAGPGGGPHVRVFSIGADGSATQIDGPLGSFMAFSPAFRGGVNVAAGEVDGNIFDGDELVVGAGPGGGPHVRVLNGNGNEFASFMAFDSSFTGGVEFGALGSNQLTVNALTGGTTQFTFGPGGTISPTIITPIGTTATLGSSTNVVVGATSGLGNVVLTTNPAGNSTVFVTPNANSLAGGSINSALTSPGATTISPFASTIDEPTTQSVGVAPGSTILTANDLATDTDFRIAALNPLATNPLLGAPV